MSKLPLATVALLRSLRHVGQIIDSTANTMEADRHRTPKAVAVARVCAATVYQAAFRLEELATLVEEIAPIVDARKTPPKRIRK